MKQNLRLAFIGSLIIFLSGCHAKPAVVKDEVLILHENQDLLNQVIIYDVFTPPVASRIYVYSSLASYEAIRFSEPGYASITDKLHGFKKMPLPLNGVNYDYRLAATIAFFKVVRNIKVFSVDSLNVYEQQVHQNFKATIDDSTYGRSVSFGEAVASVILERAKTDGYLASRGKPKYLGSNTPGKWRPTPPDYMDGVEWCWNTMKPMIMDSAAQYKPPPPPPYSVDTGSVFHKAVMEVYTIGKNLSDEQRLIARYWDDNPFVMEHAGHMLFANKKITPAGHWMGIAGIASRQTKSKLVKTAQTYAVTAIALYDAFIACWDEKYRSNYIRPVTVINESVDRAWSPFLQTPPFPEYTSGHSTITRAAATVLTNLYGERFAFNDTSDLRYIGMQRQFISFVAAADEASVSRVYGGIHYSFSVKEGANAGKKIGDNIVSKILQ